MGSRHDRSSRLPRTGSGVERYVGRLLGRCVVLRVLQEEASSDVAARPDSSPGRLVLVLYFSWMRECGTSCSSTPVCLKFLQLTDSFSRRVAPLRSLNLQDHGGHVITCP